jgi:uncharacterized iron-regulated membrane protein
MSATDASLGANSAQDADVRPRSTLYRAVWRWHFYAGILSIPVIVMLVLTGIVYLFRPQLERVMYGGMTHVSSGASVVSYDEQLKTVEERYPGTPVIGFGPPATKNRSTEFYLDNGGTGGFAPAGQTVFVNPYTGDIEGSRNNAHNPAQIALQIHGTLMTANWLGDAKWGDHFVELIAGWTVVLVVTGVFLWWPRGRAGRSLRGTLVPRINLRPSRVAWRDIHAITGVFFAFIFMFFLITGLMWTDVWGAKYGEVATRIDATYAEAPSESASIGDTFGEGSASWATSELPVFASGARPEGTTLSWNPEDGTPLDAVAARAQENGFGSGGYLVFFPDPDDEAASYMVTRYADADPKVNQSATDGRTLFVDQYTGEALGSYSFSDHGFLAQASDWGISLHEGREWGIWSQVAVLLATLALLVSASTAVVMWYKRRPQGLGAPRRVYSDSALAGLTIITLTLGIFFPLVGMSIVVLFVVDFLILRRIPVLARFFGMTGPAATEDA